MQVVMKPETIRRRAKERRATIIARRADCLVRMREAATRHGPDSVFAELLADMEARQVASLAKQESH